MSAPGTGFLRSRWLGAVVLTLGLAACSPAPEEGAGEEASAGESTQEVIVGARRQAEGWASPGTTGVFNEGGGEGQSVAGFQVSEQIRYAAVSFGAADRITFSVGAPYGGGRAELWADAVGSGRLLGVLELGAATGDWNTFATRSVDIPEIGGTHDLYLRAVSTGGDWLFKLDWFELHDTTVAPPPAGVVLPARIEAERFVAANETTAGNLGTAACTSSVNANVDLGSCADSQGGCGCSVGWAAPGEWLEYRVTNDQSATRNFDVSLRIASALSGKRVRVELPAGTPRGTVTVDAAGHAYDWGNWVTRTVAGVPVAPGTHTLRLVFEGEVNLNFLDVQASGSPPPPPPPPPPAITPLFDTGTALEPAMVEDTPTALITRFGDRARDRHARESEYHIYDHYLSFYWEQRTARIEIIDRVAKGGNDIQFDIYPQWPLAAPEFRALFRGINTKAEYFLNINATRLAPLHYRAIVNTNPKEGRALQRGDRVEIEVSQFLEAPTNGRANYYGTTVLYIVGQGGLVPWYGLGPVLASGAQDSFPLPESAWMGGRNGTLPYQYSNEPQHRFKQLSGHMSAGGVQPFMLGRRLHHTDFGDGSHTEPGNPTFPAQAGKLGPGFVARNCVACHVNNGRALPGAVGAPLQGAAVRVAADAAGAPHPQLGTYLQPQSTSGAPEGGVTLSGYTSTQGTYGDGTPYTLRRPTYAFTGVVPAFHSVRMAPQLVGLGLLEAVGEDAVAALADPDDANRDGVSGRMQVVVDPQTGARRLGRIGHKAGQARVLHQIAHALNQDMGVTTSIFPTLDRGSAQPAPAPSTEVSDADLALMYRYVATLGVAARRDLSDAQAQRGETLFAQAGCAACHAPTLTTSRYHPFAEVRGQTIRPYTDLLLHDMGPGLADTLGEAGATGAEWRTPPLWSIGLTAGVSGGEAYLHDGRARSLSEAILWHGGEGEAAKERFRTMPGADRAALLAFLRSL
jgi:CxxC motif-containing protein (DUF1111 family)